MSTKTNIDRLFEDSANASPLDAEMEKLGWFNIDTGGGCRGYEKQFDRVSFLLTRELDVPVSFDETCVLGFYVDDEIQGSFGSILARTAVELVNTFKD